MAMFFDHEVFSCPLFLLGWAFTCLVGHPHGHLRTLTVASDIMSILFAWLGIRMPGWATAWTSPYLLGCLWRYVHSLSAWFGIHMIGWASAWAFTRVAHTLSLSILHSHALCLRPDMGTMLALFPVII